jgi:hypothetical protein
MTTLVRNDDLPAAKLPKVVRSYLESRTTCLRGPTRSGSRSAKEFFGVHGAAIVMAFACASLPKCYAFRKGVQVLHLTARLQSDPIRRIGETAQLILDVMAPGGLAAEGHGVRDTQKVRLMHAAVRQLCSRSGRLGQQLGYAGQPGGSGRHALHVLDRPRSRRWSSSA